ncbi:TolC family protein [Thalassoroseus pseudoceratinae]|uniref:TolC family protein n=1 Tax=Thalassoroseus pseudoceratinae TaxID=2713176 RepID=UPI001423B1B5|nr:TolC family protein [Thalassoroseus pseudoceratinae]
MSERSGFLVVLILTAVATGGCATQSSRAVGRQNVESLNDLDEPSQSEAAGDHESDGHSFIVLTQFQADDDVNTELTEAPEDVVPPPNAVLHWELGESGEVAPGEVYDLSTLLELASANNPTLRQANLQISGTLAMAQQAGLYPNPTLAYLAENIGVDGTAGEFQGAEIQQRFVTADKLELSRNKYLQRAKVAEHLAVMQQFKVCNDVRLHYLATLEAQALLELQRELLKTAEDRLVTVKEMFNLGQANEVDVRKTTANLRRQQLDVLAAENRVRQRFLELTAVVGVELAFRPMGGPLERCGALIDFDQAYCRIRSESPELLAAVAKLRADHITLHRERVEWVPDIVVGAGPGYNFDAGDSVANAMVQVELPLFDRNQGTIRQAEADLGRQQSEIRRVEMTLRRRLSAEYNQYISALQRVENYESVVLPELRQAYEQALESYKADRQDWPDVLDTHVEYTMRRMEYTQSLRQLCAAEVMISGFLLRDGLDPAPNPTPPGHIDATPKPR